MRELPADAALLPDDELHAPPSPGGTRHGRHRSGGSFGGSFGAPFGGFSVCGDDQHTSPLSAAAGLGLGLLAPYAGDWHKGGGDGKPKEGAKGRALLERQPLLDVRRLTVSSGAWGRSCTGRNSTTWGTACAR